MGNICCVCTTNDTASLPLPHVAILMAVMNGAGFLPEQLASLAVQKGVRLSLLVSDDGSSDDSRQIIAAWAVANQAVALECREGPRRGFAENFRALILAAPEADYYAFADQDDIWLPDKLATAIMRLREAGTQPAVYGGRTRLVDEVGQPLGYSTGFRRPPEFSNALVQSIIGGNTMVLNTPGMALLRRASARSGFTSHDWWSYLVISGCGGRVIFDPTPQVLYRQHGGNLVGSNRGLSARLSRLKRLFGGEYRSLTRRNLEALGTLGDDLTPAARGQLAALRRLHEGGILTRIRALFAGGFYRQGRLGMVSLVVATLLRRI